MSILDWQIGNAKWAVVDIETTGLSSTSDRIVEIAIYHLDPDGEPRLVLSTLINPERPMAATEIHGITDADVMDAPTFGALMPRVISALAGRVIASHNIYFDYRFLQAAFMQRGQGLEVPHVCTMYLRPMLGLGPRGSLIASCEALGIPFVASHAAEADCLAAARILGAYVNVIRDRGVVSFSELARLRNYKFNASFKQSPVSDCPVDNAVQPVRRVVSANDSARVAGARAGVRFDYQRVYRDLLLGALDDGVLSSEEVAQLREIEVSGGLERSEIAEVHENLLMPAIQQMTPEGGAACLAALGLAWGFTVGPNFMVAGGAAATLVGFEDLVADWAAWNLEEWVEELDLDDTEYWHEPPSRDEPDELENAGLQIFDIITRMESTRSSFIRHTPEMAEATIGPRPEGPGWGPPILPDFDAVRMNAVHTSFGLFGRLAFWKRKARRLAAAAAEDSALACYRRAEQEWQADLDAHAAEVAAWQARAFSVIAGLDVTNADARQWFLDELKRLEFPIPLRCLVEQQGDHVRVRLLLPTEDEIPETETIWLVSGKCRLRKATIKVRKARWEKVCKLIGIRVCVSALNAFPSASGVLLVGRDPEGRGDFLEMAVSREQILRGEVDFVSLGGRWNMPHQGRSSAVRRKVG